MGRLKHATTVNPGLQLIHGSFSREACHTFPTFNSIQSVFMKVKEWSGLSRAGFALHCAATIETITNPKKGLTQIAFVERSFCK